MQRLPRFAAVLLAVITANVVVSEPSAQASTKTSGLFTYVTSDVVSGTNVASTAVPCPAGTSIVGAGAKGVKPPANFHVNGADVIEGVNGAFTAAEAPKSTVKLKGVAVCLDDAVSLTYATSSFSSTSPATGTALCTGTLVGGGAIATGTNGILTRSHPVAPVNWLARALSTPDPSTGEVTAVCVNSAGFEHDFKNKAVELGTSGTKSAVVKCPGGSRVAAGGFNSDIARVRATVPWDGKDADTVPDDGWKVTFHSVGDPGIVTAFAMCLEQV